MLDEKLIIVGLEAHTDTEVLNALSAKMYEEGYVKDSFAKAVIEREKAFPTGLLVEDDFAIAIPHADREHVNKLGMAVATRESPVPFRQMGGDENDLVPVGLVCMLAIDDPHKHMETLAKLMELFSDHDKLEEVKNCKDKETIMSLLSFAGC